MRSDHFFRTIIRLGLLSAMCLLPNAVSSQDVTVGKPLSPGDDTAVALNKIGPEAGLVYVSQAWAGTNERGTVDEPYRTFARGVNAVDSGGTVRVDVGHYAAVGVYSKPMIVRNTSNYPEVVLRGFPQLKGNASCTWGSVDCNRCVPNVRTSFLSIRSYGDALGFHLGQHPDPVLYDHWQGIQRVAYGNGRYMIATRPNIDGQAGFAVISMSSRNSTGLRYRSNRLQWHEFSGWTVPPASDRIVTTVRINDSFDHAGGIQVMGRTLAIPLDEGSGPSQVRFFDLSNPLNPVPLLPNLVRYGEGDAHTTALANLQDGRYILVVGEDHWFGFYVSNNPNSPNSMAFSHYYRWYPEEVIGGEFQHDKYQNLNFVTECQTGNLYLIGMYNDRDFPVGEDWADLFLVRNGAGDKVEIVYIDHRHLFTWSPVSFIDSSRQCNLRAAGGVYVDPSGHLYIYCAEFYNDGRQDIIRTMEFRPVPHGSCNTIEDSWVELYDHSNFGDEGRGLMIDYVDRMLEDYSDYDWVDDFEDKASSVRWCLPTGWAYRLYENKNFTGSVLTLAGTGALRQIAELNDYSFRDKVSSSCWLSPSGVCSNQ